jgi:hypothetical protein
VRPWSQAEDDIVRVGVAAKATLAAISGRLDRRSADAVAWRIRRLGLGHTRRRIGPRCPSAPWTAAEDARLARGLAAGRTLTQLKPEFPHRSRAALRHRAQSLGLRTPATPQQVARVLTLWGHQSPRRIAVEVFGNESFVDRVRAIRGHAPRDAARDWSPETEARVLELHERGLDARQIALEMPRVFERAKPSLVIYRIIRSHGLTPHPSAHGRRRSESVERLNRETVARYGLPPGMRVQHLAVLLALLGGPRSTEELTRICGFDVRRSAGGKQTTITGDLRRLGYVTYLFGSGRHGRPGCFLLTATALDLLARAGEGRTA